MAGLVTETVLRDVPTPEGLGLEGVRLRPVHPTIGLEIRGLDVSRPQPAAVVGALQALVEKHKLLIFKDQDLTDPQKGVRTPFRRDRKADSGRRRLQRGVAGGEGRPAFHECRPGRRRHDLAQRGTPTLGPAHAATCLGSRRHRTLSLDLGRGPRLLQSQYGRFQRLLLPVRLVRETHLGKPVPAA